MVKNKKKQKRKNNCLDSGISKSHYAFLIFAPSLIRKIVNPAVYLVNDEILKKDYLKIQKSMGHILWVRKMTYKTKSINVSQRNKGMW